MSDVNRQEFDALKALVEKMTAQHAEFLAVHVSRRGVAGGRGDVGPTGATGSQGIPGQSIVGPAGRDANIGECVAAAKASLASDIAAVHASISVAVDQALKVAGVIDQDGKAILLVPRNGVDGRDSEVAGPRGIPGASIIGPSGVNGRDAVVKIGNVVSGDVASVTVRVVDGVSYFDFVLPRGERGSDGADSMIAGPEGKPGSDADVAEGFESFKAELNKQVGAISGQLETRFRRIAKDDIAAALRGHISDSHKN